jgi:hypothetical protein
MKIMQLAAAGCGWPKAYVAIVISVWLSAGGLAANHLRGVIENNAVA